MRFSIFPSVYFFRYLRVSPFFFTRDFFVVLEGKDLDDLEEKPGRFKLTTLGQERENRFIY